MADSEALRAALRVAEDAIIDAAKLIDPTASGDRQAAEDLEATGFVVRKLQRVLEAGELGRAKSGTEAVRESTAA